MKKRKKRNKPKSSLGKIWYFIWEDDSFLSWVVNILLAFIIIKFLFYPGLGLLLGETSHPVVAVVSGSMEHKLVHPCKSSDLNFKINPCTEYDKSKFEICGNTFDEKKKTSFENWWNICGDYYHNYSIDKNDFKEFPLKNGFNKGDIIVLYGSKPNEIKIGDVIVFMSSIRSDPIIHRVIDKNYENNKWYFQTKGDHNAYSANYESKISEDKLIGKALFKIPFLGWVKIAFVELIQYFAQPFI